MQEQLQHWVGKELLVSRYVSTYVPTTYIYRCNI